MTVIVLPTSPDVRTYVAAVAPEMFTPARFHWYARATGAGPHLAGNRRQLLAGHSKPVTVGTGAAVNASGEVTKDSVPMLVALPVVTAIDLALASAATFPE